MNMYKIELKNMTKSFIIWIVVLIGMLTLFMSLFPSMASSGMSEIITAKMDAMPAGLLAAFGIDMLDFTDLLQYFGYAFQYILIESCVYAGILGANTLIKEESEGTIEFLYAQPITREKIITTKLLATFSVLLLLTMILFGVTVILFEMLKPDNYEYFMDLAMVFKGMFIVQLVFLSVGLLISTIIKKVSTATPIILGVVFATYMVGTFATIIEKLEWMKYLSPIHYVLPSEILKNNGNLELSYMLICVGVIIIATGGAYYRYKTKDLEI